MNSTSDLFHEDVPDEWIDKVFAVMALSPPHIPGSDETVNWMREYIHLALAREDHVSRTALRPSTTRTISIRPRGLCPTRLDRHLDRGSATADARIPHTFDTPAAVRSSAPNRYLGQLDLWAHFPRPWKIDQRRRDWDSFDWPAWVPDRAREQIEDFWQTTMGADLMLGCAPPWKTAFHRFATL